MPATSIFIKAASCGISGIGNSRISVLLGPVLTAANTLSATEKTSTNTGLTPGCRPSPLKLRRANLQQGRRSLGEGGFAHPGYDVILLGATQAVPGRTMMLRRLNEAPPQAEALDRIEEWTRERFALA